MKSQVQQPPVPTRPYLFHHRYGTLIIHHAENDPAGAVEYAERKARGMPLVPAFEVPAEQTA